MTPLDTTAAVLTAIGGVNWGLVALGRFDVVAKVTGNEFGETSAASRLVYGAVGVSAAYVLARLPRAAAS